MKRILQMTKRFKFICFVLMLCGCVDGLQAQIRLTLDSCRTLALKGNRQVLSAQTGLRKAEQEVKAYRAVFLPRVYAQGMYAYTSSDFRYQKNYPLFDVDALRAAMDQTPMPDWEKQFFGQVFARAEADLDIWLKPHHVTLSGIRFEQPLYMGGKIATAYKMAQTGRRMAELNVTRTDAETIFKTEEAYWEYVKVIELYRVALRYRQAVEGVAKDAENGVATGMVAENDRMKAQVKLGEARQKVRETENGMRLARMNLCMITGLHLLTSVVPADTLPDVQPTVLPEDIPDVSVRQEYALLNRQLELKKQQIHLARSEFMPQLTLTGGYNYINGILLNDTKLFNRPSLSAVVSLTIPLTPWIEGSHRVRSAKADLHLAEYQMKEAADLLYLEMVKAWNRWDEALLKADVARDEYLQTQENLRVVNDRYELELETLSALLEAQALRQDAHRRYIEAGVDLHMAEIIYRRVTGDAVPRAR